MAKTERAHLSCVNRIRKLIPIYSQ